MTTPLASRTRPDLRLVPPAGSAWLATAWALHTAPGLVGATAAGAAVLAGALLVVARPARRTGPSARIVAALTVAAAALAFAAAAAVGTAARVAARDASPLVALAASGASASLEVVVTDDPRAIAGGLAGQPRVLVAARARTLDSGGRHWRVDADVVVLADAASWTGLLPSQRVRAAGLLLPAEGGDLVAAAFAARGPPERLGTPSRMQRAAGDLRAGLVRAAAVLPAGPRGLLPGLVLGDTSGMDPVLVEQFRTTGLSHLVAVSGANCAIVVGAVVWLLRRAGVPRVPLAVVAALTLAGFVVLARPSPSVLRAAAMGAIALLALATGRSRVALPALAAAVLGLVLLVPSLAWSAGFALSVVATAGIVLAGPALTAALRRRRVPAGVAEALAVSLAASLATAPIIAALSGTVSLVSVPANLLAAPAVPPATVLGVLATLVSPLSEPAASGLAWLAGLPTRWLVLVAEYGAGLPDASQHWPGGATGGLLLAAGLGAAALTCLRWRAARRTLLAVGCSLLLVAVPLRALAPGWPPPGWLFVACDVGQGDALVVSAGPGQAVVVDTGPEPAAVDRCLRELGVRRIPLLVLTHLHADHVAGLPGALAGRSVGQIALGPQPEPSATFDDVTATARTAGVPVVVSVVGEGRAVQGVELTVLGPTVTARGTRSDPNNSSVVLLVRTSGLRLLLTGDVEIEAQQALLRGGADVGADVLKVPHHGSAYQDEAFLDAVGARVAVISVGEDNSYGHPSPALLAQLRTLGMQVRRTDADGAIAVGVGSDDRLWVATRARGPPRPELTGVRVTMTA